MQAPATLAAALEKAQAYEEGLDMVNEIEPRKRKGKKKVVESSDEENEEEEEERKPKKTVLKKKKKEAKVTFNPAHNLDDLDNSNNSAHAKLVKVEEESEKEEDKLLQHLLDAYDAYLGKRERDDSNDEDTPIKRPRETNIPEPKSSLNTFGLPKTTSVPVPKVIKTEINPKKKFKKKEVIKKVKGNKEKKKENATRPPLFRKKDFDIVKQLQNQLAGLS
ncbi:hypothetical protein Glove_551g5 [Diversispora epigaea]|uniref:Ribosome biogenesis protein SLX9 n=1 Tax=Diversispora epigaea TaxID=1348612 RepID=A0A397GFL4_9GLOM|nr:hypothetical protein Glove_551g5 [Diversispora epigaea]